MLIIDASSFIHRAFHAADERLTATGEHVGTLYITIKMLRNLVNHHRSRQVATVFDAEGDNFRHIIYPQYKANRDPKPPELLEQIEKLQGVVHAMGLNAVCVKGVEADDVIATLARACEKKAHNCIIATRDKDLAALVSEHVRLIDKDFAELDKAGVQMKFGVPPEQMTDFLSLQGDSSDNIPGIFGCGAKKAAALLNKYGSLAGVMANASDIPGVLGERVRESIDQVCQMREVIRLRDTLDIVKEPELYQRKPMDKEKLMALFESYEFRDMASKLGAASHKQPASAPRP